MEAASGIPFLPPPVVIPPIYRPFRNDAAPAVAALVSRLRNDDLIWANDGLGLQVRVASPLASRLDAYSEHLIRQALFEALASPSRYAIAHVLLYQRLFSPSAASSRNEWNRLRVVVQQGGHGAFDPEQQSELQSFWRGTLGY
jgi:hypothetical protein